MAKKVKVGVKIPTKNELNKRYPNMVLASENEDGNIPWLPSRFLAFNYQLGGGIPYGKILEIFGEESSGKSIAAYSFASVVTDLGGVVLWADAEQSFTQAWAIHNGLDLERVFVLRETSVETISDWIADMSIYWRSILVNNEPILLVVDSMAALDCMENINSKMVDSKADMGNRAKAIYKMFRIRSELLYRLGVAQIYINQLRKNLSAGMFSDPDTTPGGKALAFYASQRIGFYGGKQITKKVKGKERKIGRVTSIRVKKNKVAPPRATIKAAPMYNNPQHSTVGFDPYYYLNEVLLELDIIEKSNGGVYKYKGNTLCRGEENFIKLLEEDDALRKKLLRKAGVNTIGTTRKQISKIEGNLFPVESDISYTSQQDETEEEDD
jgi:recombination protein RecA